MLAKQALRKHRNVKDGSCVTEGVTLDGLLCSVTQDAKSLAERLWEEGVNPQKEDTY